MNKLNLVLFTVLLSVPLAATQPPASSDGLLRDDGTYQDGGYWATPLPWLMETLMRADPARAAAAFCDAVEDFQARHDINEWVNDKATRPRGVRDYCASAAMPLAGAKRLHVHLAATGRQLPPELAKRFDAAERWLQEQAQRVLRGSSRVGKDSVRIFTPDASGGYGAFWVRDWSYMIEGCPEAFTREEIRDGYLFLVAAQRADGCMPDRVRADGQGVYSPGGEANPFSQHGSVDQSPFMVILCHQYWKLYGDLEPFRRTAAALEKALRFTPRNPANGLVSISDATLFRPYSFLDTVPLVGDQQFDSVLFWDACAKLAEMFAADGQGARGTPWRLEAERVQKSLASLWDDRLGVFVAASEKWRQPSVWGSLFAVYSGITTLPQSERVTRWCLENYDFIVFRGQVRHLTKGTFWGRPHPEFTVAPSLEAFQHLVHAESWTEQWPDTAGKPQSRAVNAEVWTAAMQAALDGQGSLHIPARDRPYYLDGPIVLKSGQRLTADPKAEIRLRPGINTCMVRNERVANLNTRPVPVDLPLDTDLHVEGGIWTTLATAVSDNGNALGRSSKENPVFGTHGVILLQNVRRVSVKNITVRQSKPFAVHLANAHEFTVENVALDQTHRDGVHVNGPASDGHIRGVRGDSHDDNVALNAWEWKNYAPSYGPIERIVIEDVTGSPEGVTAANSIRLLPGVKRFDDGTTLDCPILDVTVRRITDIREFKLYDQPNLELGRANDFSERIGTLKDLRFEDLTFNHPGKIELHADADGIVIQNVKLNHPIAPDWHLLAIGPKSMTYKHGGESSDPARWVEIFSPDLDCTARNVRVTGVRTSGSQNDLPIEQVVRAIEQKPNPDYPKTTPKGGTGKGTWIR
jgi:hypothetical protein